METVSSMTATIMTEVQEADTTVFMLLTSILIVALTAYDYLKVQARTTEKEMKKTSTSVVEKEAETDVHLSPSEADAIIQEKKAVLEKLLSVFPGAMSSQDVLDGFKKVVEKRGYTDDNTLFAQSVCPDEVNHEEGDITDLFAKYCGEVFHLGGLSGKKMLLDHCTLTAFCIKLTILFAL